MKPGGDRLRKMHFDTSFLALSDRRAAGGPCGDDLLPCDHGRVDEQKQSGVGTFQRCMGTGHRTDHGSAIQRPQQGESRLFLVGTLLGGAYEYICSVFTEIVFGKVFWDYSGIPFNLGGRINLLYCFFWGIAAVVWFRLLYPRIARLIALILRRTGKILTAGLVVFMIANIIVSVLALVRYDSRANGLAAAHFWEQAMDIYFDNAVMERIYPNAIPQ